MNHRSDPTAADQRNSTALQIGARMSSGYPKQMLHLLTKSYHCPAKSQLFNEVSTIAQANPTAAVVLLEKMQEVHVGDVKKRLFEEVLEQVKEGRHMEKFITILKMSPVAGFRLLELLMIEPQLQDPQRYPLPLYAVIPNGRMLCSYQPANDGDRPAWMNKPSPPAWHSELRKNLPSNLQSRRDVYEVDVRVLHLPGVVNMQVLSILSMLKQDWSQLSIMDGVSVNGIITHAWSKCWSQFYCNIAWEILLLLVLLIVGIAPPPADSHLAYSLFSTVMLANLLASALRLVTGVLVCKKCTGLKWMTFLGAFAIGDIIRFILLATFMMAAKLPVDTGVERVLVTLNVLLRCVGLMSLCRVVPELGPLIMAVMRSFLPMRGMIIFMFAVFGTFAFAFLIFRDANRGTVFVLLYLYQALFLAERDAAESISGLDLAHQQTLDLGVQMFTGNGDESILMLSVAVTVAGSSLFSLVLLNLTIGMYTKFYEQMVNKASQLFFQHRAKRCVSFMLRPGWRLALVLRGMASSSSHGAWARRHIVLLACASLFFALLSLLYETGASLGAFAQLVQADERGEPFDEADLGVGIEKVILPACLFLSAALLFDAAWCYGVADVCQRNDYLWISYRTDLGFESGTDGEQQELKHLRCQLEEERIAYKRELADMRRQLQALLDKFPS